VEEMGLGSGDRVKVGRHDSKTLLITVGDSPTLRSKGEIIMDVSSNDSPGFIIRKLVSIYLSGYNLIKARAKTSRLSSVQRDAIKKLVRSKFVGTEIIEDSSEGISLQVLLNPSELTVTNALRRMFIIATSMHREAITALLEFNKDGAKEIPNTDDEVDRFGLYAIRQLKFAIESDAASDVAGLETRRDSLEYRVIVKSLERIADHAAMMAEEIKVFPSPLPKEIGKKIREFSNFSLERLEKAMNSLFLRDYETADEVVAEVAVTRQKENAIIDLASSKLKAAETSHLRLVLEDVRRTAEYSADIGEIVLNLTVEKLLKRGSKEVS
jgi:phosphate uptake regulator